MKLYFLMIALLITICVFAQNVIINEIMYDPEGGDTGYEWIELYNNSDEIIDLNNWELLKAGSNFETIFIFESNFIQPHSYFLIGENLVPNTDLTENLAFQNGGSATDGIRLISPDGFYTDTVLYDSPNSNDLPGDLQSPAINFAPDVSSGNSLARKQNGVDSNNCENDFFECTEPTPGEENFYPIDLAVFSLEITKIQSDYNIEMWVHNLSTELVDNSSSTLDIYLNNLFLVTYDLPELSPEDSTFISYNIGELTNNYNVISIEVNYQYDNNLENNVAFNTILIGEAPIIFNELMFKPGNDNQEWIELFNRTDCGYSVDNFQIFDASGGDITLNGFIEENDFLVFCQDKNQLLNCYPNLDSDKIIETENWTSLNNTDESLILFDNISTQFDSTFYFGDNCVTNYSFERVNPFEDENIEWRFCLENGGTPTRPNSIIPFQKDIELEFSEISQNDNIQHLILIKNIGLENIENAEFNCSYIINGIYPAQQIYSETIPLADSLLLSFETDFLQTGYITFKYEIISDEDLNSDNNFCFGFLNINSYPFVINEIMYDPAEDEPEWIELKINNFISDLENIIVVVDEDTLEIPNTNDEFIILTNSEEDAQFLIEKYSLGIPIITGLGNLSNDGENISVLDIQGNLIESFFFLPDWNDDIKSVSIERVNSNLSPDENNWGPSVDFATPGDENSIFVEILPPSAKLNINPNPFSNTSGIPTIISYKLPEIVSKITIRIFDLKGRLVKTITDQTLQACEGFFLWNGRDRNNRILPIGIYIILMEATSRESEKVYSSKTTIVIGN